MHVYILQPEIAVNRKTFQGLPQNIRGEHPFEGIQRSPRHRSGIAVRFPRMARWRTDKKAEEADTLDTIRALLPK